MTIVPAWFHGVRAVIAVVAVLAVAVTAVAAVWLVSGRTEDPPPTTGAMPVTIHVVKAEVSHKPFGASADAVFTPISRDFSIGIDPNTQLVTDATGIAKLAVTLSGLTTPAPTTCQINPGTTIVTLPKGPDDNLLLTLVTGTVYCKHPELERTNRPSISFPGFGELRFERAEVKAVFSPGGVARIAVAKGVVELALLEGTAGGGQVLIIEEGEQLVQDQGAGTQQVEPVQLTPEELDIFKELEETPTPPQPLVRATATTAPSPTPIPIPTETPTRAPTPALIPADTPLPVIAPTPTSTTPTPDDDDDESPTPTAIPGPTPMPGPTPTLPPTATPTPLPPLRISASSQPVFPGSTIDFNAIGGTGGDAFSIPVNNSKGSIDSGAGVYTAGPVGGVTDTVRVTDAAGNTAEVTVTVAPKLTISCPASVGPGSFGQVQATGGVGALTISISDNNSDATLNPVSGLYTAGNSSGFTDTVRVTDAAGNSAECAIPVLPTEQPSAPPGAAGPVGGSSGTGGGGGGDTGGGDDNDDDGSSSLPLQILSASVTAFAGASLTFSASGGTLPYTFSLAANNSGGSINASTGVYTAGPASGVTDTVRVTDSAGSTQQTTVTVNSVFDFLFAWFAVVGGSVASAGGEFALIGAIGQPDAGQPLAGGDFTLQGGVGTTR